MIIRKLKKDDLLDVQSWRNDKKSVFFSKNKKIITLQTHKKWFEKNLQNNKTQSYIGFFIKGYKKRKVGIVRFDFKKNYAIVSINLNPVMRGKRLSYILLSGAIIKFLKFKKIKLIAEIKKSNIPSINCFLKNNFYFLKSKSQYNFYQRLLS